MRSLTLAALLAATSYISATFAGEGATRVALVSAGGRDAAADVLILAESRLGKVPAVTLLDRREVERVLQEQKFSLSGLGDSSQAITAGIILRVDVFAVLETSPQEKTALGLVAFDALSGVRLQDVTLSERDAEDTAQKIADAVEAACAKRNRRPNTLQTICLLSVRNADLPRAMDSRCQAFAALLERSLTRSDGLAVLERNRLKHVNKDRSLPTAVQAGDLAASVLIIDLEVGHGQEGKGLRATAFLNDSAGKRLLESHAAVPNEDIQALASSLLTELLKSLKATAMPATGNRAAEARRFHHESRVLEERQDVGAALAAAESAYALEPASCVCAGQLAKTLLDSARALQHPRQADMQPKWKPTAAQWTEAYELALRALSLREENRRRENTEPFKYDLESRIFLGMVHLRVDQGLNEFCSPIRQAQIHGQVEANPAMFRFLETYRQYIIPLLMKGASECKICKHRLNKFLVTWGNFTFRGLDAAPDTHEYVNDLVLVSDRFLESWNKLGFYQLDADWNPWRFNRALCFCIPDREPVRSQLSLQDRTKLTALFESMRRHPVVLVQEYGMWGQIWLAEWCGGPSPSFDEFKKFVHKSIEQSGESADRERRFHYVAIEDAITHLKLDDSQRRHERIELLRYMLDRNEMVGNLENGDNVSTIVRDGLDALSIGSPEKIEWIGRVEAVLDGNIRLVMCAGNEKFVPRMKYYLESRRRQVESHFPDRVRPACPPPWKEVHTLIPRQIFNNREGALVAPVVHGDNLLVTAVHGQKQDWESEAFCVPLNPVGTPRSLGKVRARIHDSMWPWELGAACAGNGFYFVCAGDDITCVGYTSASAINHGIIAFPLAEGEIRKIETKELPSDRVQTMAWLDGRLYVAMEGGYIVRCDLHGGPCEVLASSRRKQHLSPFDDGLVFSVPCLIADPKRHRLLCAISIPSLVSYIDDRRWTANGLWQYDPIKGSFQQLVQINPFSKPIMGGSDINNDSFLLWCHDVAIRMDLKTDKADLVFANFGGYEILPGVKTDAAPYKKLPVAGGSYAEVGGWLWNTGGNFVRVSKEGTVEQLPPLDAEKSGTSYKYLRTTADGSRLIVGNHSAFWLLN